jgi:hypothetical protein
LVDLGVSGFAFGLVMGWSVLFMRPGLVRSGRHARAVIVAVAVWFVALAMVAGLAVRLAMPGWYLAAGVASGALAHAVFRQAIAARVLARRAGR